MTSADIELLLERYGAAWNGHDLDAIMAEHTPDSVFHLHAGGRRRPGSTPCARPSRRRSRSGPTSISRPRTCASASDHATLRWTVTATLATPLELPDASTATPSGRQVRFDAVDVLLFEDGRIARKDTYVDSLSLQQQLAEGIPAAA